MAVAAIRDELRVVVMGLDSDPRLTSLADWRITLAPIVEPFVNSLPVAHRLTIEGVMPIGNSTALEDGPRFDYHASADFLQESGFPEHVIAMLRALGGPVDGA